jgi:hypothetical protein
MEIPRNHKARLSVSMQMLDVTISELEQVIRSANREKAMTEIVDNLSSWEKVSILERIEEIKELINYIAPKLGLEKRKEETRSRILGAMTIQQVNLEEIKSKKLRGYGEVPGELREFLDPKVDKMINLVHEICKITSSKNKRTGT